MLNFVEQASWAEVVRRQGLSDQKIKIGFIIRVEKLSCCESAIKIRDVVGTPTPWSSQRVSPTTELRKANLWGHSCARRGVMHCFEAVKQAICLAHWHLPKAEAAACRSDNSSRMKDLGADIMVDDLEIIFLS